PSQVEVRVLRLPVPGFVLGALAGVMGPRPPDRMAGPHPHARIFAVPVPELPMEQTTGGRSPDHLLHDPRTRVVEPYDGRRAFEHDRSRDAVIPVDDPSVPGRRVAHARPELVVGQIGPARLVE